MKARNFFSLLAVFTVLLLVVGVGGFWGLTARSPLSLLRQGGQPVPAAALFVPKQAPIMASVLVAPHRLTDLWQLLAAPDLRGEIQSEVERLERSLLAGTGLSYGKDIRPWLGEEVTFALTSADLDQSAENGQQPGYLWVLSCRDRTLAQETLDLYWQQRALSGSSLVFEPYVGTQLVSARPVTAEASNSPTAGSQRFSTDNPQLIGASAIIGDRFVLLASSAEVIKQALVAAQSQVSLSRDPGFQSALARLPRQRIGTVVVNVPQSLRWLGLVDETNLLTTGLGEADGLFERAVLSLQPNRQGIIANTALLAAPGHEFMADPIQSESWKLGQILPSETVLAMLGHNLSALRLAASQLLEGYGLSDLGFPNLGMIKGFDLPLAPSEDSLETQPAVDWLATNYALGLVGFPDQPFDWALAVQTEPETAAVLQRLDQAATRQGLSVGSLEIDGYSLVAWSKLSVDQPRSRDRYPLRVKTEIARLRTQVEDYEILSPSITVMDQLLRPEDNPNLIESSLWRTAIAPLDQPNTGYLYVNWPQILPSLRQQFPGLRLVETAAQPLLRHLKALAITGYDSSAEMRSGAVSLYLSNRDPL